MKLWTIWVQASDGATWLESAWDDESTAENGSGYEKSLQTAKDVAKQNGGEMRVIEVDFPDGVVFGAFQPPAVTAKAVATASDEEQRS